MSRPYLVQGDPLWATHKLGTGASSFHGGGCLLMDMTEVAADFGAIDHRDPRTVNDLGVEHGCFDGSNMRIEALAEVLRLRAGPRVEQSTEVMSRMIASYLASGRHVLLAVDHDATLPAGDPGAEHWCRAFRVSTVGIVASDPAVGEATVFAPVTLQAPAQWGKQRMFGVVAFRTLSKL